ncbi:hypothetical protein LEP1GSC193_3196 [Leptospira alstonii serovar Pingchang str. 80-412]|uniref:Uncharacterized protein n=2 Tax=Leptospira alstonii TaxID=28452 RepID=M6D108_9LEPT|nr:hypothetical protein LEP1GSC194_2976 [Leptospira alstonii serovar Sichuan str. 79601]EQA79355.1 hypothetical protein LEP1GSC193_3196 [Leptospira alstonii serovar Pingchang str. 80-412]
MGTPPFILRNTLFYPALSHYEFVPKPWRKFAGVPTFQGHGRDPSLPFV